MTRKKKSVLAELDAQDAAPPRRRTWIDRVPQETRAELEEIRQAYQNGRWKMTAKNLCKLLVQRYKLANHEETVRRWLRSES